MLNCRLYMGIFIHYTSHLKEPIGKLRQRIAIGVFNMRDLPIYKTARP